MFRPRLFVPAAAILLIAGALGVSCSNRAEACSESSTCPGAALGAGASGGDGGETGAAGEPGEGTSGAGGSGDGGDGGDGGAGASGGAHTCDVTKDPAEETCLIDDEHAIFVSKQGSDENPGSKRHPVATLSRAIELAEGEKMVLVCNAVYDEQVVVSAGARVYGGFSCQDFSPSGALPRFEPSKEGFALEIADVGDSVRLTRLVFEVRDATDAGDSSIAAFVRSSPQVTLRDVTLIAGNGAAGKDGKLMPFEYPPQSALDGNPEGPATLGGDEKTCACQDGLTSVGGLGGLPAASGNQGAAGLPSRKGGEPGSAGAACNSGGGGGDGADGPSAADGPGASELGALLSDGWHPRDGGKGGNGQPGQGGGGGASRTSAGHGGGGGCGGCGGNGGRGGHGGGASVALLLIDSPVTLEGCSLRAGDAGDGGSGALGQMGQQEVGSGGLPVSTVHSCAGGNGGRGGNGGAGGGGAGGVAAGILWRGVLAPAVEDTTITHGSAGLGGEGGAEDNAGIPGTAKKIIEL